MTGGSVSIRNSQTIRKGFGRVAVYAGALLLPLILSAIFRPSTHHGFVFELGKSFALIGFVILALQFVMAARVQWIAAPFGLDIIFRFHKGMAVFAAVLLLLHPLLLSVGGAGAGLLFKLDAPWHIWCGKAALFLLLAHMALSLFRISLGIRFEQWRLLHNMAALILVLGFVHSWNAGGDLTFGTMQGLWVVLAVLATGSYFLHKIWRPRHERRRAYQVKDVKQETHNVWTLKLVPPDGRERFDYLPGQFQFITLHRGRDLPEEEHHFTISSSPTEAGYVTSTIKESGDFTATIGKTRQRDEASIQAPFGRFSYVLHPDERERTFIAGGIGITPLMSMIRHMRDTHLDRDVTLIYANKSESDILFREEIDQIRSGDFPRLRVHHVLEKAPENWKGETGLVDREKLARLCEGRIIDKAFYICGPIPMANNVIRILRDLGVSYRSIHTERFSL